MSFVSLPGHEGALCAAFANCMYPLEGENLRYVYFNFHKECAKLRFDRLSILMEKLATDLAGPFVCGATNERAVARSSCLQPVVLWCCVQHTAVWFGWFGLVVCTESRRLLFKLLVYAVTTLASFDGGLINNVFGIATRCLQRSRLVYIRAAG